MIEVWEREFFKSYHKLFVQITISHIINTSSKYLLKKKNTSRVCLVRPTNELIAYSE